MEPKLKVLLIEDNPGDARLILDALSGGKGASFEFEHVDRLSKALKRLAAGGIDVILSDLSLPDSQGLGTLVKERTQAPNLPIVVLTGTYLEALGIEAVRSGAQDYLLKERLDGHILSRALHYAIERKHAEEQLRRAATELARSKAELEQLELFAFAATHDLQEPLHKIVAFGELLKTHCASQLGPKGISYLERVQNAARHMGLMMEQLRELSRIGKEGDPFETVDLNAVLREVLTDLELRLEEAGARVETEPLPTIQADSLQMCQLFQNLIGNALKFRRTGTAPRIVVKSKALDKEFVEISIQDNGIGFDEKYLDRIFKPFQKLHSQSEFEGSGIGLAICQKIVLRHEGKITAKSTEGQGATFVVTLPKDLREEGQ